jgi:hypothetical protein
MSGTRVNPFFEEVGETAEEEVILPARLQAKESVTKDSDPPIVAYEQKFKNKKEQDAAVRRNVRRGVLVIAGALGVLSLFQFAAVVRSVALFGMVALLYVFFFGNIDTIRRKKTSLPEGIDMFCPYCPQFISKNYIWECLQCKHFSIPQFQTLHMFEITAPTGKEYRRNQVILKKEAIEMNIREPFPNLFEKCQTCQEYIDLFMCPRCKQWFRLRKESGDRQTYAYSPEYKTEVQEMYERSGRRGVEEPPALPFIPDVPEVRIRGLLPLIPPKATLEESYYHIDQWDLPEAAKAKLKEYVRHLTEYHKR